MVIKHNGVAGASDSGAEFKHKAYVRQLFGQTQYPYMYPQIIEIIYGKYLALLPRPVFN